MARQPNENEDSRIPYEVALYISQAEQRLSSLTKQQFGFMIAATLLPTIILAIVLGVIPALMRVPSNTELIDLLSDSNRQLCSLTEALLQSSPPITATTRALEVVLLEADLHEQAIEGLRRSQQQPAPGSQSIIQVIGSAAILALLGALGLQRLQNIDTEIDNLRKSVFAESESRTKLIQESLQSQIAAQVQEQFTSTRAEIQKLADRSRKIADELQQDAKQTLDQVREQVEATKTEVAEVKELVEKYPWLKSKEQVEAASRIQNLASVDQAQTLAEEFRRSNDFVAAREALKVVVEQDLPGTYADFHNAYSEAMQIHEYRLALAIAELGLKSFSEQFDLIADKTRVLVSLGKAQEAREFIEDWKRRKPDEFSRSWRPVVFYEDLFDSLELTPEALESLETAFQEVTAKLPHEIKPWSEYADLMIKQGRLDEAEIILRQALELNPLSQQLNFVLGDLLLKQGKGDESAEYLKKALNFDYQDQYQHDVNQYAVRARLAQAYEAVGYLDKARLLYQSVVNASHPPAFSMIKEYASNRLAAIALIEGELPDEDTEPSSGELLDLLSMMKDQIGESKDAGE